VSEEEKKNMAGRGSETTVDCDYCGRRVPQSKAITNYKPVIGGIKANNRYYRPMRKYYACFHCAKKFHLI